MNNGLDVVRSFREAMARQGVETDDAIFPDGNIHRFHVNGDKSYSRNGWYVLHIDDLSCGVYGSWKTGFSAKWSLKSESSMSLVDLVKYRSKISEMRYLRDLEKEKIRSKAADRAKWLWKIAKLAQINHPYLLKRRS